MSSSYITALFSFCCGGANRRQSRYQILEEEQNAATSLLDYLEHRTNVDFFTGPPLDALKTLVYSENIDLQRSAGLALAEVTVSAPEDVSHDCLSLVIFLLDSSDPEVQRSASAALGNLASRNTNKRPIILAGGLRPLIELMNSQNVEVQCNAVGCITNLSSHEANKKVIAQSEALGLLIYLARSPDRHVRENATGALLNMTHPHEDDIRSYLVQENTVPLLESLLSDPYPMIQYHCATAIANIAVDEAHRHNLSKTNPHLVDNLLHVFKNSNDNVICQATLALRNLASDPYYQVEIVQKGGLDIFYDIFDRIKAPVVACIRNISIHVDNEQAIIARGFLDRLIPLVTADYNSSNDPPHVVEEIQCHAISTLRNLAASSDESKTAIFEAGVVSGYADRLLKASEPAQREMTALIAVLALNRNLVLSAIPEEVFKALVQLTHSNCLEVRGNSAAALGNLSSKLRTYQKSGNLAVHSHNSNPFVNYWSTPHGGVSSYLEEFLYSNYPELKHIAAWTLHELEETHDLDMVKKIEESPSIIKQVQYLSTVIPEEAAGPDAEEALIKCWIEIKDLAIQCIDLLSRMKQQRGSSQDENRVSQPSNNNGMPV